MIRRLVIALSRIALLAVLMTCASTALADDSADVAKRADALQPNNRAVSFRSMDSIFPHNVIKRGTVVTELPRTPHKLDITYSFAGKQQTLDDLLARSRTQGFLVVKGGNTLKGVISERDIVNAISRSGAAALSMLVSEIASHDIVAVTPHDSLKRAMGLMTNHRVRHLPVMSDSRIVGIVSIGDVVKLRLEDLETESNVLRDVYIAAR